MIVSKDFLLYFEQTAPLLDLDPTIWCISSWNDNGIRSLAFNNSRLFRNSYFPGLGWLLKKDLWVEVNLLYKSIYELKTLMSPLVKRKFSFGTLGSLDAFINNKEK